MSARPALEAGVSLAVARRALVRAFRDAGLDSPELDARVLLQAQLGCDHAALIAFGDRLLTVEEQRCVDDLVTRRIRREPVARILGMREFWSLPFRVSAATLVPRPETETVVETALAALDAAGPRTRGVTIADLGTGSGVLLLALLSELPNATGVGTDISGDAIEIARANARELGFDGRANFVACDFGAGLDTGFDLVVSNPPYVESGAIASLPPEVRDFDPHLALDGGPDGLAAYRKIAADAARLLVPGGYLVAEIGAGQVAEVGRLLQWATLTVERVVPDLTGVSRVVLARR